MRCPICNRTVTSPVAKPFCSPNCRQVDLASWLDGSYRVAAELVDPSTEPEIPLGFEQVAYAKEPTCD